MYWVHRLYVLGLGWFHPYVYIWNCNVSCVVTVTARTLCIGSKSDYDVTHFFTASVIHFDVYLNDSSHRRCHPIYLFIYMSYSIFQFIFVVTLFIFGLFILVVLLIVNILYYWFIHFLHLIIPSHCEFNHSLNRVTH